LRDSNWGIGLTVFIKLVRFSFKGEVPFTSPVLPPPSDRSIPYLASIATGQTDIHVLRPLSHVVWDRQCARQVLLLKANVNVDIDTTFSQIKGGTLALDKKGRIY